MVVYDHELTTATVVAKTKPDRPNNTSNLILS